MLFSIDFISFLWYDLYNKTYQGVIFMGKPPGKYAWSVTVGTKGQIVIPKEARELFGIQPGDTLLLLGDAQMGIAIPPKQTFELLTGSIFGKKEE